MFLALKVRHVCAYTRTGFILIGVVLMCCIRDVFIDVWSRIYSLVSPRQGLLSHLHDQQPNSARGKGDKPVILIQPSLPSPVPLTLLTVKVGLSIT